MDDKTGAVSEYASEQRAETPFVALGQLSLKTPPFSTRATKKGNAAPTDQKEKHSDHPSFYSLKELAENGK